MAAKPFHQRVIALYVYTLPQWALFFLFYCFLGWCIETAHVSRRERRFVNRGFLNGPVIPIYGAGAIAILFATLPVRERPALVFLLGMAAATVLEYATGAAMEAIFKVRYWDYSREKYNLHGYICLNTSLAWGALSLVLVRWLHRPAERVVLSIPGRTAQALAFTLSGLFLADLAISLKAALDLRQLLIQMEEHARRFREEAQRLQKRAEVYAAFKLDGHLQRMPGGLEEAAQWIEAMERSAARLESSEAVHRLQTDLAVWKARRAELRQSIRQRLTWDKRALMRNNPGASSRHYGEALGLLRRHLEESDHRHDPS